ncbi:HopJ type III effector protein [Maribrevibacterium harenarium]|uniref:HopJ type III effector protein n=1 Tax=Maribrevibacterium harenarium TaxID=2589817 RepID=A0A501WR68_9GAMM|nr:HopJ type III effector protein [Maribrevibacterium harenarium]TPE50574.1 HopJ type III effector protein [Maribrevibacterium harenarium]
MLSVSELIKLVRTSPEKVNFRDVIATIDEHYNFTPTAFRNGDQHNGVGENNGSCKILSFAKLNELTVDETLNLFGDFYRMDVLQHPDNSDHQNIRQFMAHGWGGVDFTAAALTSK